MALELEQQGLSDDCRWGPYLYRRSGLGIENLGGDAEFARVRGHVCLDIERLLLLVQNEQSLFTIPTSRPISS